MPIRPPPDLLHAVFERSAAAFPGRVAVECGPDQLTYAELNARADRLAGRLRAAGVGPGHLVGLLAERSVPAYVGLLGVLKAGAAYVPLDPDYPRDRVAGILADAAAAAVVTAGDFAGRLADFAGMVVDLDAPPAAAKTTDVPGTEAETAVACAPGCGRPDAGVTPNDLAYVIFTSGSTGRPKGVMVEHRSVCHLVRAEADLYGVTAGDRVFQGFSLAFDASVEEVWAAFAAGATLVAGTRDLMRLGPDLGRALTELRITVFSTVPTLLAMLDGGLPTVRVLILGGEACPPELVGRWHRPGRKLFNTYGPTEATVIATAAECRPGRPVTIGKPLPGYHVVILDEGGHSVPPGEVGELHIGGVGVARGYVGRPDLTVERFIANPLRHRPGEPARLYRTGDLGLWTADGEIAFRGRADGQVKIRGFRVELGEVEAALLGAPGVRAAAATVHGTDGTAKLVGYVVPDGADGIAEAAVRAHLRARLPAYMVPAVLVPVADLPTLPSGKVDRNRLPAPAAREGAAAAGAVAPRTPLEARVAAAWAEAFGRPAVSVADDFFLDLGGHSLLAARVVSALRASPDLAHAAVGDVYRHPTVAALARALDRGTKPPAAKARPFRPTPRGRHFLCGLAQFLALYPLLGFVSLQWLGPYLVYAALVADGWAVGPAVAAAVCSLVAVYPVMLLLGVVVKWGVGGRFRAGRYPLWGVTFFRWWFVRAVLSAVPTGYLVGTPLLGLYYRLLGAKVGADSYLGTDAVGSHDLLSIGADACVGSDVGLHGATVEGGELVLGPTTIGPAVVVGNRSVLQPGATIEAGGNLGELALLRGGDVIPAGERWGGSPARPDPAADPAPHPVRRPPALRRAVLAALYAAGSVLLPLAAITAYLPGVVALNALSRRVPGLWYLLACPLVSLSFVVLFALGVAAVKWLLLGRLRAGAYPRHGLFHARLWFVDRLMELSLDVTGTLYATIYLNPWYRLLGVKVGRMAEVSTASGVPFDLLRLGAESFVADAASVGGVRVAGDAVTLAPVAIGARAFAGNGAHLPPGSDLGADGLIGCLSLLPAGAERPGTAWVGSPAFHLPQRQESTAFPAETLSRPTAKLWAQRAAIEAVRVVLPGAALVALTSLLITAVIELRGAWPLWGVVAVFPLLYAAAGGAAALAVVALKWGVSGRYRPTERPLWSHFVWRAEFVSGVRQHLADLFLLGLLKGTPFAPWYFRLLGAKIGRRVFLDTTDLCEYDLISVGDEAALNEDCTLQTHLFEDRVMKVAPVEIGARASVGGWTLVLYDTAVGPGVVVEDLSLVMKGERLPAGTRWAGSPAAPCVPPPEARP